MYSKIINSNNLVETLENLLDNLRKPEVFILTDSNTLHYCLPLISSITPADHQINIPAGEENKNLVQTAYIWKRLLELKAGRNSILINLGGGMVTDTGGFAASVFKRGIRFIHVPTTLLAMVDASIGGKTGIDFNGYKNQIGSFSFPEAIIYYFPFLDTLPPRELLSGYAEVVKQAWLEGADLWNDIMQKGFPDNITPELVFRAASLKVKTVEADPYENGERKKLNLGHTMGHAIESYSLDRDKISLLHGEAVATGIGIEAAIAVQLGIMKKEEEESLTRQLQLFPGYKISVKDIPVLLKFMLGDKKNRKGKISFSLPAGLGNYKVIDLAVNDVRQLLTKVLSNEKG